ncbi:hypothetical protein [Kineosporia succinea]|uniref:Uncharacterized protein n=1 Tax=Kineosporia succinea TaxID=84632 RepID=A0ABT9NWK5_9ACTN|nr:hypothetical protein [Kineosporia succinea]MDP9824800.1 hypothetical protein [Kineosporia succinea]
MRNTDDRLVREVKAVLDDVDQALAARPAPTPPWEDIQAFVRRSRERRRRRVALVAAAALLIGVVVTQVRVLQSSDQGRPQPAAPSFEKWDTTRGSLKDDDGWLSDFRDFAASSDVAGPESTGEPLPEPGRNVKVLFASDIGEYRVAVVTADWASNEDTQIAEFIGVRGAAADALVPGDNGATSLADSGSLYQGIVAPDLLPEGTTVDPDSAAVYVLATGDVPTVQLQQPPTIAADGKVTQNTRILEFDGGAAQADISAGGHYAVVIPSVMRSGSEYAVQEGYQDFTAGAGVDPGRLPITADPVRGNQSRVAAIVEQLALSTWMAVRQPTDTGEWQLLLAEPGGLTATGPKRVVVGVLTLPSGARVVGAGQVEADTSDDGSAGLSWLDTARLLPAGDMGDVAIAWRAADSRTVAVGPAGTESVGWTTADGQKLSGPAVDTLATIDHDDITSVRFLDGQGKELGVQTVLEPAAGIEREFGEQTLEAPDLIAAWQLPEIEDGLAGF